MRYRNFGATGWRASALGFGCMRLPVLGSPRDIDEPLAIRMIRRAVDAGVNYVDTAYPYHGGTSEVVVGKALADGYRQRVKLATKMPVWLAKEASDFDRLFDEQLHRLQTDRVDLYLLHGLGRERWNQACRLGIREWAERQVKTGRIQWLGFSFHDEFSAFKEIVDGWDRWTFCMIFYNYASETVQAGTRGLYYASGKGLAVVVMEPLMGGNLVNPPPEVQSLWDEAPAKRTPADWALQWVWSKPEVSVVLSGMSNMTQVEENLASADRSSPGLLGPMELEVVSRAAAAYEKLRPIPCTQCGYCMPCPSGVNIQRVLDIYNKSVAFANPAEAKRLYGFLKESERAGNCAECLECEGKCPQDVPVHEWLSRIKREFGS
jgi:uncharacterized protein